MADLRQAVEAASQADWIRLRGRVYAAYTVNYYGVSNAYLPNPRAVVGKVPKLTVHYRYSLSIPKTQKNEEKGTTTTLDGTLHAALAQALSRADREKAGRAAVEAPTGRCRFRETRSPRLMFKLIDGNWFDMATLGVAMVYAACRPQSRPPARILPGDGIPPLTAASLAADDAYRYLIEIGAVGVRVHTRLVRPRRLSVFG